MKYFKKLFVSLLIATLGFGGFAFANFGGGGHQTPGLWKFTSNAILPAISTWEFGATGSRIAKIWVTDLDVSGAFTFGGTMGSALDMDGYDITLDQDGDTAIVNDRDAGVADDEFDIKVANAVDWTFSADTLTGVSGSNLTLSSGTVTATTLTDGTISTTAGAVTGLASATDGTASWSSNNLSGFGTIGATGAITGASYNATANSNQIVLDSDDGSGFTTTLTDSATAARTLTFPDVTSEIATEANLTDMEVHGFIDNTETTVGFNDGTYTFTLTDAGAGWSYYRDGLKHTISGNKTTTLSGSPPSADTYYVYIDATDGTLTNSTTVWTLQDSKVPVATIHWNNGLTPKYVLVDERHTAMMTKTVHAYEHLTYGTRLESSGAISGYTLGSDVDANKQYDIAQSKIWDEDLQSTLAAITGGSDNYHIAYRTGASTWEWKQDAMPFDYTGAGYINYDNAGTMTQGQNNKWYTTYLIASNNDGLARYVHIHGQSEYSTLAAARAEQFTDLTLDGFDVAEGVAIWKFIWDTSSSYTSTGKCELDVAPIAIDTNISTSPAVPGLGTMSTQDANAVAITGGSITGITDLAVADGGTGKSSWTQYLIPYADTTTSFDQIAIGTSGQLLTSAGAGSAPSFSTYTGTSDVVTVGTIASGVWNAGAVTSSGAVQGTSLTDGTATLTGGAMSGMTTISAASGFSIDITGTGNSYAEVIQDNNAGYLAVGRTTASESSVLSVTDGGADNEPGFWQMYDDAGGGNWFWVSTDNVFRINTSQPADDDAGGYAVMDIDNGTIGASSQAMSTSTITAATSVVSTGGGTLDADGMDLDTGNAYEINGTDVLDATTLGSGVTASSLTSVGTLTSLTLGGDLTQADAGKMIFDAAPASDHTMEGDQYSATVDANAYGIASCLHMDTDGNWIEADADASTTMPCAAMAVESGTGTKNVLMQGFVRDDTWNWTPGQVIYVDTTAGTVTATAPSGTGDQVQVVGVAITADVIYFRPDWTLIEIS